MRGASSRKVPTWRRGKTLCQQWWGVPPDIRQLPPCGPCPPPPLQSLLRPAELAALLATPNPPLLTLQIITQVLGEWVGARVGGLGWMVQQRRSSRVVCRTARAGALHVQHARAEWVVGVGQPLHTYMPRGCRLGAKRGTEPPPRLTRRLCLPCWLPACPCLRARLRVPTPSSFVHPPTDRMPFDFLPRLIHLPIHHHRPHAHLHQAAAAARHFHDGGWAVAAGDVLDLT